jgi:hypothetical protein
MLFCLRSACLTTVASGRSVLRRDLEPGPSRKVPAGWALHPRSTAPDQCSYGVGSLWNLSMRSRATTSAGAASSMIAVTRATVLDRASRSIVIMYALEVAMRSGAGAETQSSCRSAAFRRGPGAIALAHRAVRRLPSVQDAGKAAHLGNVASNRPTMSPFITVVTVQDLSPEAGWHTAQFEAYRS